MKRVLVCLILCALSLAAADISGTWKATAEGPNGSMQRTFTFKVDGNKLTGETVSERFGKSVIEDGKVDGDSVSFAVTIKFQDNEMKVSYKGKLTGDTLKLTGQLPQGDTTIEWTAKKAQ